jgi:LysM repeat protein
MPATPAVATPAVARPAPRGQSASQTVGHSAAATPLRLTRRGRIAVAVATAVLAAALSLIVAVSAQATSQAPAGPGRSVTQVTVHPGQSLWSVAESADPNADTRAVVQQIVELNSLTESAVVAGQRLWVPRG